MATNGPKIVLTPKEKIEFNPLFLKYVQNECTDEEILATFKGNVTKFSRFQSYANGLIGLLKAKQIEAKITEVQNSKVLLTKGIQKHRAIIHKSRTTTVETSYRQAVRI